VYPPVIGLARGTFRALGLRFRIEGVDNIPRTGPAVLASNHVSYLDFTFVGYAAVPSGRLVRFMAKESVFRHRISGPLMRGMHHIPVDRGSGSGAFREALGALKAGEVIGIFPEATISGSFELKEIKPGAVRLAQARGAPLIPVAVWGGQRIMTKGRPRDFRHRGKALTVLVGEPLHPAKGQDAAQLTQDLAAAIRGLVTKAQQEYPDRPRGDDDRWWLPAAMGGTAPTPDEAAAMDAAEVAARGSVAEA
jgi:1-acyl-sn-glycerol-3-phosphate acyltransferase